VKAWTLRDSHVSAVVEHTRQRLPADERTAMESFIRRLYRSGAPDDILARSEEALYGIALSAWRFLARRAMGQPKIRVFNPTVEADGWHSTHTVIQLANDDMPFLVDSVSGNLAAAGIEVHFIAHPVFSVARDDAGNRQAIADGAPDQPGYRRESFIHLEIDRKSSPKLLAEIEARLAAILADVRAAVSDWRDMLAAVGSAADGLALAPKTVDAALIAESRAFLDWIKDNNFTLIGYRHYDHAAKTPQVVRGLGILRDDSRQVFRNGNAFIAVSDEVRDFLAGPNPLIVVKANVKSTVHRPVHLDYIGVKSYDDNGRVVGEHRFVGLFTSTAYNRRTQSIPYLRHKVTRVIERAGFDPLSHDGKGLLHILETFPRDELFQVDVQPLFETAMGVLYLHERPHSRAFLRQDKYGRYVSALVYVPRELYESNLRNRIEKILCEAYKGEISARHAQLSDDVIARWHFIVRTRPGDTPRVDPEDINRRIAQVARGWRDHLKEALIERAGEERGTALFERYANIFPAGYRDAFPADFAVIDIEKMEAMRGPEDVFYNVYRMAEDRDDALRLKIYHPSRVIPLSECMPLLENLGLKAIEEFAYDIRHAGDDDAAGCIHNFYLVEPEGREISLSALKGPLEDTLAAVQSGAAENDGFNALVLKADLSWRQVVVVRAYARYLRQLGTPYSEDYIRATLAEHPAIARALVALFEARFDPAREEATRRQTADAAAADIQRQLDGVASLDQDRIIRCFRNLVLATLRTNYYQSQNGEAAKPALSLKINSRALNEAPLPRPFAEIFVYSPRVEGVHLRLGPVARGGLRWSDRPEDFRTEVLGLVKAQQVKNAIIVPVGAKGGFFPKCLPKDGDRDAVVAEGVACYRTFISALLDVTDNLADSKVAPPLQTVRHDGDDPYFVVAADKGTATFSDYANEIAQARGFWLDDAFASGGSHGYDHKKMGITARGAWVSVERHFRELGVNIRKEEISVVGIGDMSGDVFGNGMLLSDRIRLVAAFDHRHIFLDPTPDPKKSFAERQRLFALPRSSWADYDAKLISKGGAVIDRKAKSVRLSAEARAALVIDAEEATPSDIIQAILRAPVDLLWIGGIGTYVKASGEAHRDVGDRGNDGLRVNADELRCRVVGEGGNLGVTQRGRIEFARKGGAINTDSVDNSGGVNCSDHEVNIKILLNGALRAGKLSRTARDKLLAEMTDEVASLVLDDNYLQTLSVSLAQAMSGKSLDPYRRLITRLEKTAELNRALEMLPSDGELAERQMRHEGLTRPELAIVISYAKMALTDALLKNPVLDEPYLEADLAGYFPARLAGKYRAAMRGHRLRREIIATELANQLVNRLGPEFAFGIAEELDVPLADVVKAYVVIRDLFALSPLWREIDALDNKVPAAIQTILYLEVTDFTRRLVLWSLRRGHGAATIADSVERLNDGIKALLKTPSSVLGVAGAKALEQKAAMYGDHKVPADLAAHVAGLEAHWTSGDVVEVAAALKRPADSVIGPYFELGVKVGYDWLRASAELLTVEDHWDRLALASIVDDLLDQQRELAQRLLADSKSGREGDAVAAWAKQQHATLQRVEHFLNEMKATPLTVAKLGYAAHFLRTTLLR